MLAHKRFIQVAFVPALLFGIIPFGIYMISSGFSLYTLLVLLIIAIALSFLAEWKAPYEPTWNKSHKDRRRDILHALVNETATVFSIASLPFIAELLPEFGFWPIAWPLWAQVLLAIIVADCGITLVHYFSHKYPILWRFHAVHHSIKRMYGFNGLMKHPIHQAIETVGGLLPLILLGLPLEVAALLAFAIYIQLLLQHSNVDVKIGPLRYFLALSPVHRFHHIKWSSEGDVNFGLFTTLWDRLLGTAVYDQDRDFSSDDLGIASQPDYPDAYVRQLLQPFRTSDAREILGRSF